MKLKLLEGHEMVRKYMGDSTMYLSNLSQLPGVISFGHAALRAQTGAVLEESSWLKILATQHFHSTDHSTLTLLPAFCLPFNLTSMLVGVFKCSFPIRNCRFLPRNVFHLLELGTPHHDAARSQL